MMLARAHADWWTAAVGRVSTDLAPPLYPVLLHAWSSLGVQDALVRFLSVVFGVLAVAVMSRLSGRPERRLCGPHGCPGAPRKCRAPRSVTPDLLALLEAIRVGAGSKPAPTVAVQHDTPRYLPGKRPGGEGWLAALIFAIAPSQIYHAQQANVYALVALLSALIFVTAQRAGQGERWAWPALALLAVVSAYTYYGLAFLFAGMTGWLAATYLHQSRKVLQPRLHPKPPTIGVGLAVVGAAVLPLLPIALQRSAEGANAWTGSYAVLSDWAGIRLLVAGLISDGIVAPLFPYAQVPTWLALLLTLIFAIGAYRRPTWAIGGWLVPLSLAYVASGFGVYPFFERHLLFVAPVVYALLAVGLLSLRPAAVRRLAVAALVIVLVTGWPALGLDVPWRANPPQEELRPILETVAPQRRATDATYVGYGATAAAAHYQELGLLPADAYMHMGWFAGRIGVQADQALGSAAGKSRLWVVMTHMQADEEEQLAQALTRRGARLTQRVAAPGAAILLFELPPLAHSEIRGPGTTSY